MSPARGCGESPHARRALLDEQSLLRCALLDERRGLVRRFSRDRRDPRVRGGEADDEEEERKHEDEEKHRQMLKRRAGVPEA